MKIEISKLFELYLSRQDLRPSSIRFKRRALKYFIDEYGDIPPAEVTGTIAEDFRTILAVGRSKRSANGYLANFKPFWEWLYRHKRIPENPFYGLRLFRITKIERVTFTANELSKMLRIANQIWRVRVCFGLLGMRRSEVLNLCGCDIKLSNPPHIVLCPKKASSDTWPFDLKDHAIRFVALPEKMYFDDIVVSLHKDVIELMRQPWPYVCLEEKYHTKLMEWQRDNKPGFEEDCLDPTGNYQRVFRALQKRAGVSPLKRFHELRAAFATKMIEGYGLDAAAKALGHSSVDTTTRYNRKPKMSLVSDMTKLAENCYQTPVL